VQAGAVAHEHAPQAQVEVQDCVPYVLQLCVVAGEHPPWPAQLPLPPQVPALQAPPVAQGVPSGAGLWVSLHAGGDLEQSSTPTSQGLAGGHDPPGTHAVHAPDSHTPPEQPVPSGAAPPLSAHTGAPDVHSIVPTWQTSPGVHAVPDTQPSAFACASPPDPCESAPASPPARWALSKSTPSRPLHPATSTPSANATLTLTTDLSAALAPSRVYLSRPHSGQTQTNG
jgi:hypothetical protein